MRISTMQMFRQGIDTILDRQTKLIETQQQLSTGKRINNPSDDPTGAAQIIGYSEIAAITKQYQDNAGMAQFRLEMEDAALDSVVDNLQRARELTVQALNDTNSASDRSAIALEVRQILDEVIGLANRRDGNGQYLFSGFQSQTTPFIDGGGGVFTYAGDSGQRSIQIAPARLVADGDSGQAVFMDIPGTSGGTESLFVSLYSLATDLEADSPNGNSLDQIDNAINHMSDYRSRVGARLNAIDSQRNINDALLIQLTKARSDVEDVDYAEAASRLSQETVVLQAAQQAFIKVQNLTLFNYL
jgi:flagellar hook-associated protein 3 FlgL